MEKQENEYECLLLELTDCIQDTENELYNSLRSIKFSEESVSSLAVDTTLSRLSESYDSALLLISNLFYFESFAIIRLIFEQLVYCINICDITDLEYEKLNKKKRKNQLNSTNINKIKELFPQLKLGPFYEYLSSKTHIGLKEASKFVKYDREINKVVVQSRTIERAVEASFFLLKVVDLHSLTLEYSLRNHMKSVPKYLKKDGNNFLPNNNRNLKLIIDSQVEKMKKIKTIHNNG